MNQYMELICRDILNKKPITLAPILRPQPYEKNYMGYTIAQWFIILNNTAPEKWMIHNPLITNNNGNTCMMLWIKFAREDLKTKIPKWMIHDPWIKNGYNKSAITLWYYYTDLPLPVFLQKKKTEDDIIEEFSNEELYNASITSYKTLVKSKSKIIRDLCKQTIGTRDFVYIEPQNLYKRYQNNLEVVYGKIDEEEFHELVSRKHRRILFNEIVYYDLYFKPR